jgi:hypothetical protein
VCVGTANYSGGNGAKVGNAPATKNHTPAQ